MSTVNEDIDIALDAIDRLKADLISEVEACPAYETPQEMTIRFGRQRLATELLRRYFNESTG